MTSFPPLAAIRCFEAAARHRSFTAAAAELSITQAAVSFQIKLLEERVGVALFDRRAGKIALSEAGQRLAPSIAEAFGLMRNAFDDLSNIAGGTLRVTAQVSVATNWLIPRLKAFQTRHPKITLSLDVTRDVPDILRGDVDVGLRAGDGKWPGVVAHRLLSAECTPMLSPTLLTFSKLECPADLLEFPLIDPLDHWWDQWFKAAGVGAPDFSNRAGIRVLNQQLAARAAIAGQGAAMLMPAFYQDELTAGLLVEPFPSIHCTIGDSQYWLIYSHASRHSTKIRAFRDWILEEVASATSLNRL